MIIDTHSHLNFREFKDDFSAVIDRLIAEKMGAIIVGSQFDTSSRAIEILDKYPEYPLWAAIGLHPVHLQEIDIEENGTKFRSRAENFDYDSYLKLARKCPRVVAIGECGLEFYRLNKYFSDEEIVKVKNKQLETFQKHLELASELNLPLILHCRGSENTPNDAYWQIIDLLEKFNHKKENKLRGVIHCFGADFAVAQKFLDLGFYLGFTGIITFPKSEKLHEIIKNIPVERILIETDSPYLAPVPMRGKRNEPIYVKYVLTKIAEIRRENVDEMEMFIEKNTRKLFNFK